MVRILEFDSVDDLLKYNAAQSGKWLTADEFNSYLESRGHRRIKSIQGRKAYCERNGITVKKQGREYYYQVG